MAPPLWAFLLLVIAVLLALMFKRRRDHFNLFKRLGLPGPAPSILIGNFRELARLKPVRAFEEWVGKYGETFGYFYGDRPVIVTTDRELLAKVLLKDAMLFFNRPYLFNLDTAHAIGSRQVHVVRKAEETKAFRSQFTSAFTATKLKQVIETSDGCVKTLIEELKESAVQAKEVDIAQYFRLFAFDAVGQTTLGLNFNIQKTKEVPPLFTHLERHAELNINTVTDLIATCFPPSFVQPLLRLLGSMGLVKSTLDEGAKAMNSLVDAQRELRQSPGNRSDIMENLLHRNVFGRPMTREEITANAIVACFAGFDTTSVTLSLVTFRLARHPEWQEMVREEVLGQWDASERYSNLGKLKLLERFINETLRLDLPSVNFVAREAGQDYQYGDLLIPKGTTVQAPLHLLCKDPSVFTNPEVFDPDHFLGDIPATSFMPFGNGPRNCVAARYAMLLAKLTIARVLQHYRIRLGADFEHLAALPLVESGITRRPNAVVVKLDLLK